jgi:hypothetical protein
MSQSCDSEPGQAEIEPPRRIERSSSTESVPSLQAEDSVMDESDRSSTLKQVRLKVEVPRIESAN